MEPTTEISDSLLTQAKSIVEKAVDKRGDVRSLKTGNVGDIKSFEDSISPAVYTVYLDSATKAVNEGRWDTAYEEGISLAVKSTVEMLSNQQ